MFKSFSIRIKQYQNGYAVEVKVPRRMFGYKWVNIVSYAGLPNMPFYYSTYHGAKLDVLRMIEMQLTG